MQEELTFTRWGSLCSIKANYKHSHFHKFPFTFVVNGGNFTQVALSVEVKVSEWIGGLFSEALRMLGIVYIAVF